MGAKAILRTAKHTTIKGVGGMGEHMNRTMHTPNADPERAHLNRTWTPAGGWRGWAEVRPLSGTQVAAFESRLAEFKAAGGKVQKDAVLTIELMLSASPEAFKREDFKLDDWAQAQIEWIHKTFGKNNLIEAVLHLDESTPHVHALVFPEVVGIDRRGGNRRAGCAPTMDSDREVKHRLSASRWLNGAKKLSQLQTSYASAMKPFGLERGQERSRAKHQTVKEFYAKVEQAERQAERRDGIVADAVALPEPKILATPRQRKEQLEKQKKLAKIATDLARIVKNREAQALKLQQELGATEGRYQGLQLLVGGEIAAEALEKVSAARDELQKTLDELRASAALERESLRDRMQADIEHWRQHAIELESKLDASTQREQELKSKLMQWQDYANTLKEELEPAPRRGLRMG